MSNYSTDLFQTSLFGENLLVFCGASRNKLMFSSANKHVTPRWPRSISAALNFPSDRGFRQDDLAKLRALMIPEFLKPEALQRFLPIIDSMVKEHLEIAWSPYNEVKVLPLTKEYTIAVTCWVLVNIKDLEHINRFANLFGLLTKGVLSALIKLQGTTFSRAVREGKFLHEEFLAIIRERKMELLEKKGPTKEDLLSHMLLMTNHENDKGMNDKLIA
ncbi:beta-amyrin 28-monooxygenase-like [Carya illinoinensis]|uniref:beta-amyrin 28-monooxygenase-like n=1 Tax=Carya illinoinensis TaxID=32201 RepID=UPI001C71D41E|nr:beta-amyrin 28-monooxygenase-like [Carya illinoinensis]